MGPLLLFIFPQDASAGHPLEAMNTTRIPNEFEFKMDMAGKVYGSAFVMRMKTEVATLSQVLYCFSCIFIYVLLFFFRRLLRRIVCVGLLNNP